MILKSNQKFKFLSSPHYYLGAVKNGPVLRRGDNQTFDTISLAIVLLCQNPGYAPSFNFLPG
jgi:hypothetical protein